MRLLHARNAGDRARYRASAARMRTKPTSGLELAGRLCRCTGYAGIVRAIQRVLAEGVPTVPPEPPALPVLPVISAPSRVVSAPARGGTELTQTMHIGLPLAPVWAVIRDPALVASCVPGARLDGCVAGDSLRGEVRASLGPIEAVFAGDGTMTFDDAGYRAEISGTGRDNRSRTMLNARAVLDIARAG